MWVLRTAAVKWAIQRLTQQRIQNFFPAYLHLRAVAIETGSAVDIPARWSSLIELLDVPGGPPGKPYYRPMLHRAGTSPWLNSNLAGSYAPSSLRDQPRRVVTSSGHLYSLREGHVELAREHLLYGEPVSAVALALFFYRNRGFYGPNLTATVPVRLLRSELQFEDPHSGDFDRLFTMEADTSPAEPFERFGHGPASALDPAGAS